MNVKNSASDLLIPYGWLVWGFSYWLIYPSPASSSCQQGFKNRSEPEPPSPTPSIFIWRWDGGRRGGDSDSPTLAACREFKSSQWGQKDWIHFKHIFSAFQSHWVKQQRNVSFCSTGRWPDCWVMMLFLPGLVNGCCEASSLLTGFLYTFNFLQNNTHHLVQYVHLESTLKPQTPLWRVRSQRSLHCSHTVNKV